MPTGKRTDPFIHDPVRGARGEPLARAVTQPTLARAGAVFYPPAGRAGARGPPLHYATPVNRPRSEVYPIANSTNVRAANPVAPAATSS